MLAVDSAIFEFFPGLRLVVCVAEGLGNPNGAETRNELDMACRNILNAPGFEPPQAHPRIAPWWRAFEKMQVSPSKFPPAIAALVKAAKKNKLRSINPIVDFYNALSLRLVVPIGAWDLDGLDNGRLQLGFTKGGEPFRALGSASVEYVATGEVAYFDASEIVTRHFIWKQSEKGKISPSTKRVCILSEVLPGCGDTAVREIKDGLCDGLRRIFGVEAKCTIMPDEGLVIA